MLGEMEGDVDGNEACSGNSNGMSWDGRRGRWVPLVYRYAFPCSPFLRPPHAKERFGFDPSKQHHVTIGKREHGDGGGGGMVLSEREWSVSDMYNEDDDFVDMPDISGEDMVSSVASSVAVGVAVPPSSPPPPLFPDFSVPDSFIF